MFYASLYSVSLASLQAKIHVCCVENYVRSQYLLTQQSLLCKKTEIPIKTDRDISYHRTTIEHKPNVNYVNLNYTVANWCLSC